MQLKLEHHVRPPEDSSSLSEEMDQQYQWLHAARLHAIAEDSGALVVRWLPDGSRTYVNSAYCKYFRLTPDECRTIKIQDTVSKEFWYELQGKIRALSPVTPVVTYEHKIAPTKRQSSRWVKWTHRGFFDNHGKLFEIQTTGVDVTEKRAAEASFEQIAHGLINIRGERFFEHLAIHIADILEADFTCIARFENGALQPLAVLEGSRLVRDTPIDFANTPCEQALISPELVFKSNLQTSYPNSPWLKEIDAQSYLGTAMKDDEGKLLGLVCILFKRPISAPGLRQSLLSVCAAIGSAELMHIRDKERGYALEQQLRQSQKMDAVGRLAGGIAHDFNNLLTIIFGHSAILQQANLSLAARDSAMEINEAAERAAALTGQLLAFSRKQVMIFRDHDLNKVISNIVRLVSRVLGEQIRLEFDLQDNIPHIHADNGMVEQVIMNLLVNARDAMPSGGRIVISTSSKIIPDVNNPSTTRHWTELSITDSGVGIPPEHLDKIFEPFFTTKPLGDGTGLGLATVFGIIEQHQGHIDVSSTTGVGTTFTIRFPAVAKPTSNQHSKPVCTPPKRGQGETIVVLEDEEILRKLAKNILQNHGYNVILVENASELLHYTDTMLEQVALLFTDIVMPGEYSGWDIARQLRVRRPDLPVIFTSGYDLKDVDSKLPTEPGNAYLQKPYKTDHLASLVRDTLDSKPSTVQ